MNSFSSTFLSNRYFSGCHRPSAPIFQQRDKHVSGNVFQQLYFNLGLDWTQLREPFVVLLQRAERLTEPELAQESVMVGTVTQQRLGI
jgi:hypothetical protein